MRKSVIETETMILIIGYGNSLRRDDGAGVWLAHHLTQQLRQQHHPVHYLACQQLTPELAADLADPGVMAVFFVDTRVVAPSEVAPQVRIEPLAADNGSPSTGHHLTPATLLLYTAHLYQCIPLAWQITVPGHDFGFGETFSPETQAALTEAEHSFWPRFQDIVSASLKPAPHTASARPLPPDASF